MINETKKKFYKISPLSELILILILLSSLFAGYLDTSIPAFIFMFIILGIYLFQIKLKFSQIITLCIFIYLIIVLLSSKSIC